MMKPYIVLFLLIGAPVVWASDPYHLKLEAPIKTWDEAIPLGNGLTGGLLWGEGNEIRLSLDRGDLWDERLPEICQQDNWTYKTIKTLKAAGNQKEISRLFDAPYHEAYPTKLPGGRLVLTLDESLKAQAFELDMKKALGRVELTGGDLFCFFCATEPVALIKASGEVSYKFLRPAGLDKLGYKPAEFGESENMTWMVQDAALGLKYAVVTGRRTQGDASVLAVAITSNKDGGDVLAVGKQRVAKALDTGYGKLLETHSYWWKRFWDISSVTLPHEPIQRHYNLVRYFYGAASRPDAPPMPLQGVWTRDDGGLPPWKGDFHHDLNTQMTYLPYLAARLFDCGESFINYNWDRLPTYRAFAKKFYDVEGAVMPGVATLAGKATGGWAQYSLSPTNGLWVGQTFYLHWRYTMDKTFLEKKAYPWLKEITQGVAHLLEEKEGKLFLPLSSSPEIHNNSLKAWLIPNSTYDLSLMQWAFLALAEMAEALDLPEENKYWKELDGKLEEFPVDNQKVLMFAKNEPFNESHRHHSHTMAIHPLGTYTNQEVIHATLDKMIAKGTQAWTGYSFSWFSSILARCGREEAALQYLVDYERAFILRNGFHANGDQINAGLSGFRYRPFTLEGNFLAMDAVHEMLLQSWDNSICVFPAVSEKWKNVSFENLCAQGGFQVSARRKGGKTTHVSITSTVNQPLVLLNPFNGKNFTTNQKIELKNNKIYCGMNAKDTLVLNNE